MRWHRAKQWISLTFVAVLVLLLVSSQRAEAVSCNGATWYGPGFWGNRMACGGRLTRHTIAVAHRSLRCGTLVRVTVRGHEGRNRRTATHLARVEDRGPFGVCWDWDLSARLAIHLTGHPPHSINRVRVTVLGGPHRH